MTGSLVWVVAASLTTCRVDTLITPSTADIQLTVAQDTVGIADSIQLTAVVTADGKASSALRVTWSSDAPTVAMVDSTGRVKGLVRGAATITAQVENPVLLPEPLSANAAIRVVVPRVEIAVTDSILTSVGDTVCLTPLARDAQGASLPGIAPDSLRPDSVFTPGAPGCWVASRSSGPVAFRAWLDTARATQFVRVRQVAAALSVAPDSVGFNSLTEQRSLTLTAVDRRGNPIPADGISWTSDDTTLVSVSPTGGLFSRANGATWVRAASDTVSDSVHVTVRQQVRTVVVTPAADTLVSVGARQRLQAVARDSLAQEITDAVFSWVSLAPNTVRLVADSGSHADFEAAGEGSASISVRGAAGGRDADTLAHLDVMFALSSVTITPTRPTVSYLGDTLRFGATGRDVNDSSVANLRVAWSSSAPTKVSIDPVSGLITTRDSGTAIIRGRHDSGQEDTTTVTVAPPVLDVDDAVFADSAVRGASTPVAGGRLVRNVGSAPLTSTARLAGGSTWLTVSPDSFPLIVDEEKSLQLSANPTGLADGVYRDTVIVHATRSADSLQRIPVEFRIFCPVAPITPDAIVAGTLASDDCLARHRPSGNADFYGFTGTSGDTVAVSMTAGGSVDPFLVLLGPTGAVDALNDDCSPATRNACITRVLGATGSYTIEATTFSPAPGAYTLVVSRAAAPAAPTALAQLKPTGAAVPAGGTTEFTSAVFQATGQDANTFDTLRLQIEVRPDSEPFTAPTDTGAPTPNGLGGVTLSASAELTDSTSYHWRARTCDQTGRCGTWTPFAADPAFAVLATGPVMTVTPGTIRDSARVGSADSITRTLFIDNTGGGTIAWSVTNRTAWLTITPSNGSSPPGATLTLTLKPNGLASGMHVDTVIVTDAGTALGSPDTTIVTFVIFEPILDVTPTTISRSANAASGATFHDTLGINNIGTGPLPWTATAESAWVVLDRTSGAAPDKLPLRIIPDGRLEGTYSARVVVSSEPPGATGSPDTVTITLIVSQPVLAVSLASVTDSANYGTAAPRDVSLQITNAAGGTLTWSATESPDAPWLSIVAPASGAAPATVTLRMDPNPGGAFLSPGTYAGAVVLTSPEAVNDPISVPVQFLVRQPVLSVLVDSVFDTVTVGATAPRVIPVPIANANGGVLAWTASDSAPASSWLSLTPASGGGSLDTLFVTLDPTNLGGGMHRDTVIIRADSATGNPRRLPVRFDVLRPPDPPASPGQFRTSDGTPMAVGGVTTGTSVVFRATLTDPDPGDSLRLELQVEKVGTAFSATAAMSGAVASGQVASVTFGAPFEDNSGYHWRVRGCDQTNRCSAWASFPQPSPNSEAVPDFFANPVPEAPTLQPASLNQFQSNGTTPIGVGGQTQSDPGTVVFHGFVTDPDPGDLISLHVEIRDVNTTFSASTHVGTGVSTSNAARVTVSGIAGGLLGTAYHWRARACDQTGQCGAWFSFGNNSDDIIPLVAPADTDFRVP